MATYVLVHGGDRDGSIWDETAKHLREHGHKVYCPSMKSVTIATLDENISEIIDYIHAHKLKNFILVGHSYGCMVITGVTNQLSDLVMMIVFLDGPIPKRGQSLYEITQENNFDSLAHGLTKDPAVMSHLDFDPQRVFSRPKALIYCLEGEFRQIMKSSYEEAKKPENDWIDFCLDTKHACMLSQPKQVAAILCGMNLFVHSETN